MTDFLFPSKHPSLIVSWRSDYGDGAKAAACTDKDRNPFVALCRFNEYDILQDRNGWPTESFRFHRGRVLKLSLPLTLFTVTAHAEASPLGLTLSVLRCKMFGFRTIACGWIQTPWTMEERRPKPEFENLFFDGGDHE